MIVDVSKVEIQPTFKIGTMYVDSSNTKWKYVKVTIGYFADSYDNPVELFVYRWLPNIVELTTEVQNSGEQK